MANANAIPGKLKLFALVRDKDGRPKIDNPQTLPAEIFAALTADEVEEIYKGDLPPHLKNLEV